ncbi:MAG: sensory box histidine kinase/response regulator [Fibrobacteres bacterium]|nr:sensory box histidine kinase/response regulator [Fibrobacterota bacterium]
MATESRVLRAQAIFGSTLTPGTAQSVRATNVLVVDDDESVRELMATILELDGYKVLRARHSEEALLMNRGFPGTIHLLLTDFCMKPHQNGFELARQVRQSRPGIRVIYTSGYVEQDVIQEEIESETSLFLAKPFSPHFLIGCVRKALQVQA